MTAGKCYFWRYFWRIFGQPTGASVIELAIDTEVQVTTYFALPRRGHASGVHGCPFEMLKLKPKAV